MERDNLQHAFIWNLLNTIPLIQLITFSEKQRIESIKLPTHPPYLMQPDHVRCVAHVHTAVDDADGIR